MKVVYLKKAKKYKGIIGKLKELVCQRFIYVLKKKKDDYNIFEYFDKYDKCYNHLMRKLKMSKVTHVVLPDNMENNIINLKFKLNNIEILTGRSVLCNLAYEIFMKISEIKKEVPEKQKVYIMLHELSNVNKKAITRIIKKASSVHIVTDNIKVFNLYEEEIQNEFGILISVSNNKSKSLRNAPIIINIDYNEVEINEFKINRTAIIVNLLNPLKINKKSFSGYCINNIKVFSKNILEKLDKIDITMLEYSSIKLIEAEVMNKTKELKNMEITELIGSRENPIRSFMKG